MRLAKSVFVLLAVFLAWTVPAHAQGTGSTVTGNLNLFLGAKALDDTDWAPVDEHAEVGLVGDIRAANWPVSIEVRLLSSVSDTVLIGPDLVEMETSELDLGVRKTWGAGTNMHPYVSGGLAKIDAEVTVLGVGSVSDDGVGLWVAGGIYWVLGGSFNLGVDLMISSAEVDFGTGVDGNIGGGHFNFLAGFHF